MYVLSAMIQSLISPRLIYARTAQLEEQYGQYERLSEEYILKRAAVCVAP